MESIDSCKIDKIKTTLEYAMFLKHIFDKRKIMCFYKYNNSLGGTLYKMLHLNNCVSDDKDFYIFLFREYIYDKDDIDHYEEINLFLKIIYFFYKDVYSIFNTVILENLYITFLKNYTKYNMHNRIIEYLYKNNKNYTFSKLYAYYESRDVCISLPIIIDFASNNTKNFTDIFDVIKLQIEKNKDEWLKIQKCKTEINELYELIKYNQTGGMSVNRITWITLVVLISNR